MKKIIKSPIAWVVAVLAVLVLLGVATPVFDFWFRWSRFNCRCEEVDIATGRLRFTRYRLYRKVSDEIRPSALSACLPEEMIAGAKPDWQRVNTFSPGVNHSPHHAFHGAIYQLHELAEIWEDREWYDFPENLKRQSALHVLALWQFSHDDVLARKYIFELGKIRDSDKKNRIFAALPTLNMPLTETRGGRVIRTVFYPDGMPMSRMEGYMDATGAFVSDGKRDDFPEAGESADGEKPSLR
ncbi:MAG: hypothetical protein J0M04_17155 [Verrucomicrobia bacterium]|nr:hypothetical protein [Verrucomicrobiota bacterium]